MKKVLFLAPNYKYIRTTVTGVTKDLMRRKIQFTTNVHVYPTADKYKEGELKNLYLKTDVVEVVFNHDDPVTWTNETLFGIHYIYGQKELVNAMIQKFPSIAVTRKGSIQRFIVENSRSGPTGLIIDDLVPAKTQYIPVIKNVHFNNPMTIVLWDDGTKTIVKCQDGDTYSEEVGLALCIAKKALGNKGNFNDIFKKWVPEKRTVEVLVSETIDKSCIGNAVVDRIKELEESFNEFKRKVDRGFINDT